MIAAALVAAVLAQAPEASDDEAAPASVEERLAKLEAETRRLRAAVKNPPPTSHLTMGDVKLRFQGYLDVGAFKAFGDGVAYRFDAGKVNHPKDAAVPWVFDGDPWSNTVNAQGDSADLGLDRTNLARFDPIHSQGRPTFLVNTVNLGLVASLGESLLAELSLNFMPRQGSLGSPGDLFDVDLAYLEWIVSKDFDLHVFAGKFESSFGIEYRQRKASDRFNVTPSIIARYSTSTNTGVRIRGSFFDKHFTYAVALTNGGPSTEVFAHFFDELDGTYMKTVSGRVSVRFPFESVFLEWGISGVVGPQDHQPEDRLIAWQVGTDVKLAVSDLTLRAEYLKAFAPGGGIASAPRLDAEGFYVDAAYQLTGLVGLYGRIDFRVARLRADTNLYISKVGRGTLGVRLDFNFHVAAKVEFIRVQELGGPEIDDDVLTGSVVLKF